jgi:X-linked retinitis pigmentosa GTPase regulator
LGHRKDCKKPQLIAFDQPILDVQCGNYHTIVLTANGEVYTSGYNFYGQLGQGTFDTQDVLRKMITHFKVSRIFACSAHTLLESEENELYGCGYNGCGQLGLSVFYEKVASLARVKPFSRNRAKVVACRFGNHSLVVTDDNELFATGKNDSGQIGNGLEGDVNTFTPITVGISNQDKIVSVMCGMYHTVVITGM